MADVTSRHAPAAAYIAAAVNLAAGLVMLLALRYGIPAGESDLSAWIAYIGDHILAWRVGWLVWNFSAISLLGFLVALATRWRGKAPLLCGLALLCAAAGLAADLGAETILAVVSPGLQEETYAVVESTAVALTGYLGNGLSAVGGILLTFAGRRELPPRLLEDDARQEFQGSEPPSKIARLASATVYLGRRANRSAANQTLAPWELGCR